VYLTILSFPEKAGFLQCHSMHKCGLSVRESVTFVYSVEMSKRIFRIFSLSGCHTILIFQYETLWQYSDGDPLSVSKIAVFDQYLALTSSITTGLSTVESDYST